MTARRRLQGIVTSDKMMKTVVVQISRTYRHPVYQKVVHESKKVMAHDELDAKIGDEVMIVESKPISHKVRWVVQEILKKSEIQEIGVEEG
ncbi:MAG: 30S ribosomal protein S17 [Chloroflexi bacterium]|jgi:small subunit ribosomal protein S17|nr:30S ribosomal protein S17 [Chloroflexota bacterium]